MLYPRFINIKRPHIWHHHQRGWKYVIELLRANFHSPDGITFISSVDDFVEQEQFIQESWIGFLHQVPNTHGRWFPDLERIFARRAWKENLRFCKGLLVLSEYIRSFVIDHAKNVPVSKLYYPAAPAMVRFSTTAFRNRQPKRILNIGQYLRNYQSFYDLRVVGYQKFLVCHHGVNLDDIRTNDSVTVIGSLAGRDYDQIFEDSLIFLNLKDSSANTTIVECIAANTPVLVNRVGGVCEYLGENYPLYYQNMEEASDKAADVDLILAASRYLEQSRAKTLTGKAHFLRSFVESEVYASLAEIAT